MSPLALPPGPVASPPGISPPSTLGVVMPKTSPSRTVSTRVPMGKMIDIGDGTAISFYLPEKMRGRTDIEGEQSPAAKRNAVINWWDQTTDRLSMQIEFIAITSTELEVTRPFNWLRSRAYGSYLGDLILRPPSTFSLTSLWEFSPGSLTWETDGNIARSSTMVAPKLTVTFELVRVDESATKETVMLG
jgi:hypothetical protein